MKTEGKYKEKCFFPELLLLFFKSVTRNPKARRANKLLLLLGQTDTFNSF
jgi:hypothetical protein